MCFLTGFHQPNRDDDDDDDQEPINSEIVHPVQRQVPPGKCPFTGRPKKGVPRLVHTNLDIFETGVFFYPDSLWTEGRLV